MELKPGQIAVIQGITYLIEDVEENRHGYKFATGRVIGKRGKPTRRLDLLGNRSNGTWGINVRRWMTV